MEDRRWNNFIAVLATAQHVTREVEHRPVGDYGAILSLVVHAADFDGWAITLFQRAVAEIERLRERLRAEQDDCAATENELEVAEAALAKVGMAKCQGKGCGIWHRAVLMHNDLCAECHATEVSIGNIFGDQRAEDEANYNQIVRDGLRWSR